MSEAGRKGVSRKKDRAMKGPSPERVAEFAAAARRIVVERTTAADVVTQLLRETPREEWLSLATRPEIQNNGALEQLSREIDTAVRRRPEDALPLSALAVAIAESIPDDRYPRVITAQMRAHAWKDRAQALMFNDRHEEAFSAVEKAENALAAFGTVAHDRAVVELTKANVLQSLGRFDEALAALDPARIIFSSHGDNRRALLCGVSKGALHYRRGEYAVALETFRELLPMAQIVTDDFTLGSLHNNLACCLLELGQFREANIHFSNAIAHCTNAGREIDALRTEMASGRLFAAKGKVSEGIARLRTAREKFLSHGLTEEAGICALDIAVALLSEYRHNEAEGIATTALQELRDSTLNPRSKTALEYLERELLAHEATPAVVRHVRDYIEALQSDPNRDFVALL
jgi:tetratricopeptide (TPR) repeat protein